MKNTSWRKEMRNLAGVKEADTYITRELDWAGIEAVQGEQSSGEVPYSIRGKIGPWTISRAWYYWVASAGEDGLDVKVADEMHNKAYPVKGDREPETYGKVIRVAGHCGCPPPAEWADHYDVDGKKIIVDPDGEQQDQFNRFVESGFLEENDEYRFAPRLDGVVDKSVVSSYHIDTQEGLNEFARVVRATYDTE